MKFHLYSFFLLLLLSLGIGNFAVYGDSYEVREINGTNNNQENFEYGSAPIALVRISPSDYSDGDSMPAGDDRPSAREISNFVAAQDEPILIDKGLSGFIWQWGQFVDHDIDLTTTGSESFNIPVPAGDPDFDPFNTGTQVIHMSRSVFEQGSSPRQQVNQITSYIDASNVYGSDNTRAETLRAEDGKLILDDDNLLPKNTFGLPNAAMGPADDFFVSGDIRANEQIGLTAMHTLFAREHNRIAQELSEKHPEWDPEEIYQYSRKVVGAEMQVITYNEFLPNVIGMNTIPPYSGYDPNVNPGISNEFSTASFRFGHSLLPSDLLRITSDGSIKEVKLRDAFFNPYIIPADGGIDSILRGLASQKSQEVDTKIIDDVRNFLFGPPGAGGFDLASLNIQRGRDHGLADYNTVRISYGLEPRESFKEITSNTDLQEKLESLYGDVDNIDLWVASLAEDHEPGAIVGETSQTIIADQFIRLRDGDRFWYQNDPFFLENKDLMKDVEQTRLSDVIKRNTSIDGELQDDVFKCKNPNWHSSLQMHLCHNKSD